MFIAKYCITSSCPVGQEKPSAFDGGGGGGIIPLFPQLHSKQQRTTTRNDLNRDPELHGMTTFETRNAPQKLRQSLYRDESSGIKTAFAGDSFIASDRL
jgi:hypothetical protein